MKFNLKNLNPGTFFQFEEGARICLRLCNADQYEKIRKQTTKKITSFKNGQKMTTEEIDDRAYNELLWDYMIVSWEGLDDDDGNPIPCTKEMKTLLMNESLRFAHWVSDRLRELTVMIAEENKEAEKN